MTKEFSDETENYQARCALLSGTYLPVASSEVDCFGKLCLAADPVLLHSVPGFGPFVKTSRPLYQQYGKIGLKMQTTTRLTRHPHR